MIPRSRLLVGARLASTCALAAGVIAAPEETRQLQDSPPNDKIWSSGIVPPARAAYDAAVASYAACSTDDAAWLVMQAFATNPGVAIEDRLSGVSVMLSRSTRARVVYVLGRACDSFGPPVVAPWGSYLVELDAILRGAVVRLGSPIEPALTSAESPTVLRGLQVAASRRLFDLRDPYVSRLMSWSGWQRDDVSAVARAIAAAYWAAPADGWIFGRWDDGVESELLQAAGARWTASRAIDMFAISTLVARQHAPVTALLEQMQSEMSSGVVATNINQGTTGSRFFVEKQLRRIKMVASQAALASFVVSDFGSSASGPDDRDRLFAVDELLRRGAKPEYVRELVTEFFQRMTPGKAPSLPYSRDFGSMYALKAELMRRGILTNSDWPNINVPLLPPRSSHWVPEAPAPVAPVSR